MYNFRNLIYYPAEVLLMLELLIYSQETGELVTKKTSVPWGAFDLFLLWGLPHVLWHGMEDGKVTYWGVAVDLRAGGETTGTKLRREGQERLDQQRAARKEQSDRQGKVREKRAVQADSHEKLLEKIASRKEEGALPGAMEEGKGGRIDISV